MFTIKNITIKNFLSVGNVSQAIDFTKQELTLVLGENLDQGGNDSRNGVGKSAILNAISYALYGEALVKIKKDNLVNKINAKGAIVTIEFEKDNTKYRIERGRRPAILKFIADGKTSGEDETNESQGDNRLTQQEIERTISMSHIMFKQIVALNTYTEPFLSMRSNDQRLIIEQLLGITKLSEKAEKLKEQLKETRDYVTEENFRIQAKKESNERIRENISRLERSSRLWEKKQKENIADIKETLNGLFGLDIEAEIESHSENKIRKTIAQEKTAIEKANASVVKELKLYKKNLLLAERAFSTTTSSKACPTCKQDMDTETHKQVHKKYETQVSEATAKIEEKEKLIADFDEEANKLIVPAIKTTAYNTVEEAYNHKSTVESLIKEVEKEEKEENPYIGQIDDLTKHGIQEIDLNKVDDLIKKRDHQDFLLKLLTNKDSFIRKSIIDQNLSYLNHRLSEYLHAMGLPHQVKFRPDLEVEIAELGNTYDFDNLSRGEKTRLILSLSWAFRDVYESLNPGINLLLIDELLDSGLDTSGVENALSILKKMSREQNRNIYLISHRDELIGRVSSVLKVIKSGGFTTFDNTDTNLI